MYLRKNILIIKKYWQSFFYTPLIILQLQQIISAIVVTIDTDLYIIKRNK